MSTLVIDLTTDEHEQYQPLPPTPVTVKEECEPEEEIIFEREEENPKKKPKEQDSLIVHLRT